MVFLAFMLVARQRCWSFGDFASSPSVNVNAYVDIGACTACGYGIVRCCPYDTCRILMVDWARFYCFYLFNFYQWTFCWQRFIVLPGCCQSCMKTATCCIFWPAPGDTIISLLPEEMRLSPLFNCRVGSAGAAVKYYQYVEPGVYLKCGQTRVGCIRFSVDSSGYDRYFLISSLICIVLINCVPLLVPFTEFCCFWILRKLLFCRSSLFETGL